MPDAILRLIRVLLADDDSRTVFHGTVVRYYYAPPYRIGEHPVMMEGFHRHHLGGGPPQPAMCQVSSYASRTLGNTPTCTKKCLRAFKGSSETKNPILHRGQRGSGQSGISLQRSDIRPLSRTVIWSAT